MNEGYNLFNIYVSFNFNWDNWFSNKGDIMAKNEKILESNKKVRHIQFITVIILFLCLIGQVIALYFDMNNIFYVLEYLFGFVFGIVCGFIIGIKVIK